MKIWQTAMMVVAPLGLWACGDDDEEAKKSEKKGTIVEIATANGSFETLVGALASTGLDETLSGAGPFTVFAPTDAAFDLLPDGVLASLSDETLSAILTYHVYAGKALAADVVGLTSVATVQGENLGISVQGGTVYLGGFAQVTTTDIIADNGVIHVIDAVLLPPSIDFPGTIVDALSAAPGFSTLVGAVVTADLATTLAGTNGGDGYTVFAPTNAAFEALGVDLGTLTTQALSDILLYHVVGDTVEAATVVGLTSATTLEGGSVAIAVSGGVVTLDGAADVVRTDIRTSNGVIHVIDAVLAP